jgi:hypothetical protein
LDKTMTRPSAFLLTMLPQSKGEAATDAAALIAAASPKWLPLLRETSEVAGLVLPILGCAWLIIQIGFKIHAARRGRNN